MVLGPPVFDGDMAENGDAESGVACMKSNSDEQMQLKRIKIDRSQTRWIVISLVVYSFLAEGFSKTCFSQIEDTTAQLFQVSTETAGWLNLAPSISCVMAAFFMSWAAACRFVGIRKWCLAAAVLVTLAFVFVVVASLNGSIIGLAFLGQAFSGVANAINFCLVPLMVGSWFPENEQVTAIALTFSGLNAGNIVGFLVPAKILPEFNKRDAVVELVGSIVFQDGKEIQPEPITWAEQVSISLTAIFASFLAASVLFGFFSFLFIFDSPTPLQLITRSEGNAQTTPTYSMEDETVLAHKASTFQVQFARAKNVTKSTIVSWNQISKSLLTTKKFILPAIPYSIIISLGLMWYTIMPDMVKSSHFIDESAGVENATSVTKKSDSNWIAGRVLSTYAAGCVLAGIATGKITQLLNYRSEGIACVSTWCAVITSVGICVGFVTNTLTAVYVFIFSFGFFVIAASTSLVALIVKHATSENRFSAGAWLTFLQSITACMLPLLARTLFENIGPMSIHACQIILSSLSAVFLVFALRFLK